MIRRSLKSISAVGLFLCAPVLLGAAFYGAPYPLDGFEETGIRRLKAFQMILNGTMPGRINIPAGGRHPTSAVQLKLRGVNDSFDISADTPRDSALQAGLQRLVAQRHPSYRVALLDITDPSNPRYAGIRPDEGYLPGSVGKLLVMTGLFNELKQRFPNDISARKELLRNTQVVADDFVIPNSHEVPIVADDWSRVSYRSIRVGDVFSLWEWVDHMVSPSSNAAGSMVWKEALLLDAFGAEYPVSAERSAEFIRTTPRQQLAERSVRVIEDPMIAAGLDTSSLYLRTYFTNTAQRTIPSGGSHSTPNQLLRWLVKLEQGQLVDQWSSLEMKKLMYFTRRRYRFAFSPELNDAMVYFKSGSLYRCQAEEGYECGQYRGNVINLMHSVAIVESMPGSGDRHVYLMSMMSNVLKVNSASEHLEIASGIQRLMRTIHSQ